MRKATTQNNPSAAIQCFADAVHRQKGFTLVELLVGLFLSLFIAGVAITYFVSSSRTFRTHTNESIVQENARFALELLSRSVRHAGVNPSNSIANEMQVIYDGGLCTSSESGLSDGGSGTTACTRDGANNATWNNSDRFAVDYMVDASDSATNVTVSGCNGEDITVAAGSELHLASVYWTADIDGDGVRSLYCQALNIDANSAEGTAVPVIEGVERMQVQYGVDSNEDGIVERYQSFTHLGSNNRDKVRTVRIGLLMNSGLLNEDAASEFSEARTFTLLDGATETFAADAVFRQIYTTTIMVHNVRGVDPFDS